MACSINSATTTIATTAASTLELEHIPLTQRLRFLHSGSGYSDTPSLLMPPVDIIVKKEHEDSDLQVTCRKVQTNVREEEKTSINTSSLSQNPIHCDVPTAAKVEDSDIDDGRKTSLQSDFPALKVKQEISEDIVDDLDHMVLKERLRLLLARKPPGLSTPISEGGSGGLLENINKQCVEKLNEEIHSADGKAEMGRDQCNDIPEASKISLPELPAAGLQEHDILKSGAMVKQLDSHEEQGVAAIKKDGSSSSTCRISVKVKDEPWDSSEFHNVNEEIMGSISTELSNVKSEWEVQDVNTDDLVEHISLIDRLNFLKSGDDSSLNSSKSYSFFKKSGFSSFTYSSNASESPDTISIKRLRKRKRTATDSVQTALEEDAPGLLQVLLNKGVLVDEIKLYGETENDEDLDESSCEDGFSELEAVISKIFFQRQSYIKFPIVRAAKTSRANYCLACLISLVEQSRYLQFRNWPVEWGWCRDLQSFIFVFEKHNRIVLERPEYGYATYFFELIRSLPVEWQIKRLVIAMKLSNCSRISLIEDKELVVGEHLSEGEAKVLMEYGWTPNTGLGTMLNYRDRVVHDRKNEKESSEWRSKIGKLLMNGFNGGNIVTENVPKKVEEFIRARSPDVKLEESDI
ncbi:hypothetical protein HN51_050166 [Arachis hypogaea]|uniref:Uncharacterized protein n=1 Tax=Arachis hypogaea TaxID=3818 RepID=A0A444YCH6_ARAHY|nr:uncharacterized protein LOC107609214 [Arachis ipaensis]XP_025666616.1 uncharacterized protein LOC112764975 isoform X1 [Arachis hypogaea]QHN91843.1 uncharacterized protein DS421_17g578480 [Arachis hypogaea]RYQ99623.1 hypothetical protein Ahy_B07g087573 [Arachis hypogaea]